MQRRFAWINGVVDAGSTFGIEHVDVLGLCAKADRVTTSDVELRLELGDDVCPRMVDHGAVQEQMAPEVFNDPDAAREVRNEVATRPSDVQMLGADTNRDTAPTAAR